tara:strand:- start:498 stop:746 length:249 start_codon:yes stop_codon:yes gene_type:complete
MAKKSIEKRLLNAFKRGEELSKMGIRAKLRIPRTILNDYWFDGTYIRTCRKLVSEGVLKRIKRGVYVLSNAPLIRQDEHDAD